MQRIENKAAAEGSQRRECFEPSEGHSGDEPDRLSFDMSRQGGQWEARRRFNGILVSDDEGQRR